MRLFKCYFFNSLYSLYVNIFLDKIGQNIIGIFRACLAISNGWRIVAHGCILYVKKKYMMFNSIFSHKHKKKGVNCGGQWAVTCLSRHFPRLTRPKRPELSAAIQIPRLSSSIDLKRADEVLYFVAFVRPIAISRRKGERETEEARKKGRKEGRSKRQKRRRKSTWPPPRHDAGGNVETALNNEETTDPRTSRVPDSLVLSSPLLPRFLSFRAPCSFSLSLPFSRNPPTLSALPRGPRSAFLSMAARALI